jgi:plastocyanin
MPATMSRPRALLATALALGAAAVPAAGCGGEPAAQAVKGRVLEVHASEFRFSPQNVVMTPGRTTIRLVDDGKLPHNLKLLRNGTRIGGPATVQHGGSSKWDVVLREGRYRMVCTIQNHDDLGQYGQIVVRRPR